MKNSTRIAAIAAVVGGAIAAATTASAALNLPTQSCSYTFNNNLKKGMRSADVVNLQKVLNMYPQTTVATTGAGSKGMETNYFGAATYNAVVKFQELHQADVLTPISTTKGTGNVFALTRAVLNQVCVTNGGSTTTPATTTPAANVSVSISNTTPNTTLVAGQAAAKLADFTFTGNGAVTSLKFVRTGVSSNSTINNIYLYDGATKIAGPAYTLADGSINFNLGSGLFTVNGSRTLSVRADVASGTTGQTVGVMAAAVNGATVSASGNQLPISAVTTASVLLSNGISTSTINAGTNNVVVWRADANVGVHKVNFQKVTLRYAGSAPASALANLAVYVDGVKAGTANIAADGYVTFDLGNGVNMATGLRSIEVRADVVSGVARDFTFSLDQNSDIWFADAELNSISSIYGTTNTNSVIVTPTGTVTNGKITIAAGDITISNVGLTSTTVNGGASSATLSKYTIKANGEDLRLDRIVVAVTNTATTTQNTTSGLQNLTLSINGSTIVSPVSTNATSVTFPASGIMNYVIPAGQTVTLEVKSDVSNTAGYAYESGSIKTDLTSVEYYKLGSYASATTGATTGSTVTILSGKGTFAKTVGWVDQTVETNKSNVKVGSFTLTANSAENLTVTEVAVGTIATPSTNLANYSNLKVQDGSTVLAQTSTLSATNTMSVNVAVAAGTSKTFDVYADIGNATTAVKVDMAIKYRGTTLSSTSAVAAGATTTPSKGSYTSVTVNSTPVSQYVIGGTTNSLIATFVVKSTTAPATITKLVFNSVLTDGSTSTNMIQKVTVNGQSGTFTNGVAEITGLNIAVPAGNGGVSLPVYVDYACFQGQSVSGTSCNLSGVAASSSVKLVTIEGMSGGSSISTSTAATSAAMQVVSSKPVVTSTTVSTGSTLNAVTPVKVGTVTVAADAQGPIEITKLAWAIGGTIGGAELRDGSNVITTVSCTAAGVCTFASPDMINAGTSKTYSLYATGTPLAASASLTTAPSQSGFLWNDVNGNGTGLTGTLITNWPSESYTIKN